MGAVPFPVILPLLVAAFIAALSPVLNRRVADAIAWLTSLAVLMICLFLVYASRAHPLVYWFGNWGPDANRFPIGINFLVDAAGAGMASFVALLVLCAMTVSLAYFDSVHSLFHALMMVFLAAMCGLCLTGDLFNLFVWFELMTAVAVALCGYRCDETGPLQGALNFAVTNSIGAFLTLSGISLLYAWSGSLNFAGIADALQHRPAPPGFIAVSLILVMAGFLIKSATVPFHFWLADAHAVAPTPVCVLFSGIMVELGLFAFVRVFFGIFAPALGSDIEHLRPILLTIGSLTAVVGAVACFGQRHIKRMLAFSTVSHSGIMLIGVGVLTGESVGAVGLYLLGHGLVKATLFICAGILLDRFTSVDEFDLHGKGRSLPGIGLMMGVAGLALGGFAPFGPFVGASLLHHALHHVGAAWLIWIIGLAEAITAGAVLRVVGRVFLGWGDSKGPPIDGPPEGREKSETKPSDHTPWCMWLPALALLALSLVPFCSPEFRRAAFRHGAAEVQTSQFQENVLSGKAGDVQAIEPDRLGFVAEQSAVVGAIILALLSLGRLGSATPLILPLRFAHRSMKVLQSGRIGDYVAWLVLGLAAWGGWIALALTRLT